MYDTENCSGTFWKLTNPNTYSKSHCRISPSILSRYEKGISAIASCKLLNMLENCIEIWWANRDIRFKKLQANKEEKVDFRANLKSVQKDKFGLEELKSGTKTGEDLSKKAEGEGEAAAAAEWKIAAWPPQKKMSNNSQFSCIRYEFYRCSYSIFSRTIKKKNSNRCKL